MSREAAIVVGGVEVPEALIAQEISNHPAPNIEQARKLAAHALAIRALLLSRAMELDIQAVPLFDEEGREETGEEARIRVLLEQEVKPAAPSEAECRRFYEARPNAFQSPAVTEASHILVAATGPDEALWDAARLTAESHLALVQARPEAFGDLARRVSDCPSRTSGGALGQLVRGDLAPEVEEALAGLEPDAVCPSPVRSRFGWHVLKLDRRAESQRLPFDHVRPWIEDMLQERSWRAAAARYVGELGEAAREQGVAISLTTEGQVSGGPVSLGALLDMEAEGFRAWLETADPELAGLARTACEASGGDMGGWVQGLLRGHLAAADDEEWTRLLSHAKDAEDPALACARAVLRQKLQPAPRTFTVLKRRA
jgi:peptidyl-prolyl cis-trans isomerase C